MRSYGIIQKTLKVSLLELNLTLVIPKIHFMLILL